MINKEFYDIGMTIPEDDEIYKRMPPERREALLRKTPTVEAPVAKTQIPVEHSDPREGYSEASTEIRFKRFLVPDYGIEGVITGTGSIFVEKNVSFTSQFQNIDHFCEEVGLNQDNIIWVD